MSLRLLGHIELPAHVREGGFDHAAVHHELSRLYVAHTSNDDVDVVDCASNRFLRSLHGLKDRKSTRLNSSHSQISYAVFCLKKKRTRLRGGRRVPVDLGTSDPGSVDDAPAPDA